MAETQTSQEEIDNLNKALKNVLSPEDYAEFIKGNKPLGDEGADGGKEEALEKAFGLAKEELKGMKKAYKLKKGEMLKNPELKELKKAYKAKKSEIKKAFADKWNEQKESREKESEEEKAAKKAEKKVKKGITDTIKPLDNTDLVKSISDSFDAKINQIVTSNNNLVKSLTEENASLKQAIETIGKTSNGFRSAKNFSVIEKSNENELDESGRTRLSVSGQKKIVLAALETALEKATEPNIKKSIETDILGYNMSPDGIVSKDVAEYLYNNLNIRLEK
jgi:hypothetical protein